MLPSFFDHEISGAQGDGVRATNADHLRDERAEADSRLPDWSGEDLHGLDVGHQKGGGYVHLQEHAEHLDGDGGSTDSGLEIIVDLLQTNLATW